MCLHIALGRVPFSTVASRVPCMNTFRLAQWVMLTEKYDHLKYRRALTAMSVGPVDRNWLIQACGLSPRETKALLQELLRANALIVVPNGGNAEDGMDDVVSVPAPYPDRRGGADASRAGARALATTMRRLRRWLGKRVATGQPLGFDDLG